MLGTIYSAYVAKVQAGETKMVAERLSTFPNKEFNTMYKNVVGKDVSNETARFENVREVITAFQSM